MYPNRDNALPYTDPFDDRCPICGASGECPDGAAVPTDSLPFDPDGSDYGEADGSPLRHYRVTVSHGGIPANTFTTTMRLNDSDAARYGPAAVLIP